MGLNQQTAHSGFNCLDFREKNGCLIQKTGGKYKLGGEGEKNPSFSHYGKNIY
jgi:hypothetical protein